MAAPVTPCAQDTSLGVLPRLHTELISPHARVASRHRRQSTARSCGVRPCYAWHDPCTKTRLDARFDCSDSGTGRRASRPACRGVPALVSDSATGVSATETASRRLQTGCISFG